MRVGFYTVFKRDPECYVMADIMVRSVRQAMPDVEITHFTNKQSPIVSGVDCAVRLDDGPLLERRMCAYASCVGDWLLLDTDIVVQRDVRHVFERQPPFDVAVSDREWNLVKCHYKYTREMPYNTGVVFQRSPAFYRRALAIWRGYPKEKRANWLSEQYAFAETAFERTYTLDVLPGMIYNRPPATFDEDLSEAAIVHYKGPERKLWMLTRYQPNQGYELAMQRN